MTQEQFDALVAWVDLRVRLMIRLDEESTQERGRALALINQIEFLDNEAARVLVNPPEITLEDVL